MTEGNVETDLEFAMVIYKRKLHFRHNQYLSNKGIKQTINSRRIVLIGYWSTGQRIIL